MRISTTAIALALTLGQSVSASFAGCYDPAVLELDLGNSTANASTLAECSVRPRSCPSVNRVDTDTSRRIADRTESQRSPCLVTTRARVPAPSYPPSPSVQPLLISSRQYARMVCSL